MLAVASAGSCSPITELALLTDALVPLSRCLTSTPLPLWPEFHSCVWTDLRLNNGGLPSFVTRSKQLDIDQEKKEVAK